MAILLIIFYHLIPQHIPNGFLGVDVFLVVSGYLLYLNLQNKGLNAIDFVNRRVLRIFPPLIVTVIVTLPAGVYLMHCTDVCAAAQTGISALLGYSNVELKKSLGNYFAEDSSYHLLVHTWYLSVTIQIYLIFLIGCFLLRKFSRKVVITLLSVVAVTTLYFTYRYEIEQFFLNFGITLGKERHPESHFKMMPRMWEPLAGMLVCLIPTSSSRWKANIATLAGIALVLTPSLCPVEAFGRCMLFVVAGTVLVLKYTPQSSLKFVFSNRFFMWVGSISFSLYLVHIPVFTLYKSVLFYPPSPVHYAAMLAITFALGMLLYYAVETRRFSLRCTLIGWGTAIALAGGLLYTDGMKNYIFTTSNAFSPESHTTWKHHSTSATAKGYSNQLLPHWFMLMHYIDRTMPAKQYRKLNLTPPLLQIGKAELPPSFILLGDSHANSLYMGLDNIFHKADKSGIYVQMRVLPFTNIHYEGETYTKEQSEAMFAYLEEHPELKTVFLTNRYTSRLLLRNAIDWEGYPVSPTPEILEQAMTSFLERLRAMGKNVVLFTPTPECHKGMPLRYIRWCLRYSRQPEESVVAITKDEYLEYNKDMLTVLNNLEKKGLCHLVHIGMAAFRDGDKISTIHKGLPILWDDNHLTAAGATMLLENVQEEVFEHVNATQLQAE